MQWRIVLCPPGYITIGTCVNQNLDKVGSLLHGCMERRQTPLLTFRTRTPVARIVWGGSIFQEKGQGGEIGLLNVNHDREVGEVELCVGRLLQKSWQDSREIRILCAQT